MKRCPTCGESTIVNSWNFCRRDGAKLVAMPTCLACGTEVLDTDNFCVQCGEAVKGETARVLSDGDFHFQVRCTDPSCALAQPIRTVWRESAEEVGEYHVAHSGHKCVVERIGEHGD